MMRIAKTEDIPDIVSFLHMCFIDQGFPEKGYTYCTETMTDMISHCIETEGFVAIEEDSDKIIGCIVCIVGPTIMNKSQSMAYEVAWNVHPSLSNYKKMKILMGLSDKATKWAEIVDLYLHIGVNDSDAALERFLEKTGFERRERYFCLKTKEDRDG